MFMAQTNGVKKSEYERLRADYDAAFARLRSLAHHPAADTQAEEAALTVYRESRERLARYLVSQSPQTPASRSNEEVRSLAYRLWEESGRPMGHPDEYWYRAENLVRKPRSSRS
jgi:hypothetical protein